LQEPGGDRAAPADCARAYRTAGAPRTTSSARRNSGTLARADGLRVRAPRSNPTPLDTKNTGDEEPVAKRVQLRAEDWVARGIAVDEVEYHPGEEGAEDGLQSCLRREGFEAEEQGGRDAHPDLGGGVLEPGGRAAG
jgi:hypothetical protein